MCVAFRGPSQAYDESSAPVANQMQASMCAASKITKTVPTIPECSTVQCSAVRYNQRERLQFWPQANLAENVL